MPNSYAQMPQYSMPDSASDICRVYSTVDISSITFDIMIIVKYIRHMEKSTLLAIAETWSYWRASPAASIPRTVALPTSLSPRVALVVQGVRRCGKSTLLSQFIRHYKLKRRDCVFLNFEDPRLAGSLRLETLDLLVDAFEELRPGTSQLTFFLDEIQWIPSWERWLSARLGRRSRHVFVVSGSNAQLLSGELSSALTGRHLTVELYPFDYYEFRQANPTASVESYLHHGGFPEPALSDDADLLLRQYFTDVLERDVRQRVGARSILALRLIVQMLFESAGAEASLRRIAGASGVAVDTVSGYLDACEQAYLMFSCPWFAWSARKRAHRNRKYYPVDSGLRRVVVTRTGQDLGKALECATYIELRKRFRDVFYWRDGGEVDFVVQAESGPIPIQVTLSESEPRHERALELFYEQYPQAGEALFITPANFPAAFDRLM